MERQALLSRRILSLSWMDVNKFLKKYFHPEIQSDELDIIGAVYNVDSGKVDWL